MYDTRLWMLSLMTVWHWSHVHIGISLLYSDLAKEKSHHDCGAFLDNPAHHMKKLKKHSNGNGVFTLDKNQASSSGNELLNRSFKKRRSFSFLGRIKVCILLIA